MVKLVLSCGACARTETRGCRDLARSGGRATAVSLGSAWSAGREKLLFCVVVSERIRRSLILIHTENHPRISGGSPTGSLGKRATAARIHHAFLLSMNPPPAFAEPDRIEPTGLCSAR